MSYNNVQLFSTWKLADKLCEWQLSVFNDIEQIGEDSLRKSDPDELAARLAKEAKVAVPRLLLEKRRLDAKEAKMAHGPNSEPIWGRILTFYIPIEGHPALLRMWPSKPFNENPPMVEGISNDNELILVYEATDRDPQQVETFLQERLAWIHRRLDAVVEEAVSFNDELGEKVRLRVLERRERLLKDHDFLEALGIPLERRDDPPKTGFVPTVRRTTPVARSGTETGERSAEWTLLDEHYEHILSVMNNMALVMEKSPKAFRDLDEEDLRWHFLFQLNGHYEGGATGETFNLGKTDVHVQWDGRAVFIAECKFWDGPKSLESTLDQLLSYTTWRNTKSAILIFNENKNFSRVLNEIPPAVRNHPAYAEEVSYGASDTSFRFILRHPDDPLRTLTVTVLAFDVPRNRAGA